MPAGTIALTNNSTTVSGNGTAFTSELKENDFIVAVVGGVTYTLGVKAVNSDTNATLITKYDGPAVTGSAWTPMPNAALVGITAQVAADVAKAIRGYNLDKANWQGIYSNKASVTVTLPDLSTYTGPSWGYMANQFGNQLLKDNNLSDLTDIKAARDTLGVMEKSKNLSDIPEKAEARNNLGLGSAATSNIQTAANDNSLGAVMTSGAFGLGSYGIPLDNANGGRVSCIYAATGAASVNFFDAYSAILAICRNGSVASQIQPTTDGKIALRGCNSGNWTPWYEIYSTKNTTKASDGTLKAASPVARIVQCQNATQRPDVNEEGFTWCGCGTANEEAEGISIKRFDTGVYVLTGSAGLAKEGWQLLPPRDPQGSGDLGIVEAEETESGGLKISLYKRRYRLNDENGDIEVAKGDLIDVPVSSWIDVRLDMPEDSIFNLRQKAMLEAAENAEPESGS